MSSDQRLDIQWLRAIAAIEVVLWHSDLITKHISSGLLSETAYRWIGGIGVEVFFVVSGYVICMRAAKYSTGIKFALARIIRLFPLYWLFTSLVILAQLLNDKWRLNSLQLDLPFALSSYFTLPQQRYPILTLGWTLEHEMLFYGLVALSMMLPWQNRSASRGAVALVLLVLGFTGVVIGTGPSERFWDYHIASPYMLCFGIGWILQCVHDRGWTGDLVVLGCMCAIVLPIAALFGDAREADLVYRIGIAAAIFAGVCAIPSLRVDNGLNRFMGMVGDASYSIYLSHWFVLSAVGKLLGSVAAPAFAALLVRLSGILFCVFIGLVLYAWIEKPLDRRLRRVILGPARPALLMPGALERSGGGQ